MPNKKVVIVNGSARHPSHTSQVLEYLIQELDWTQIVLKEHNITYYDYDHKNQSDDFLKLIESRILSADIILFATPVYWYTMSARLKTFLDRISDLLTIKKDLGRQLRGKSMALLSCGSDDELFEGFEMPFRESANYLGMEYLGLCKTWIDESPLSDEAKENIDKFRNLLLNA